MRCYYHIRDGDILVEDVEGRDCATDVAAMYGALQAARELVSRSNDDGAADHRSFVVEDKSGRLIGQLPFSTSLVAG